MIGSERLTRITNWEDRTTCVLFGDGGGAAVVEWDEDRAGVLATYMKNDDDDTNALTCPSAFDSPQPFDVNGVSKEAAVAGDPGNARIDEELGVTEAVAAGRPRQSLFMHGQTIFKFAASAMGNAIDEVCKRADVDIDDVKLIVPHQANERIIKYAAKRCGLPGFHWRSRKRFFRLRADGAFRRVRIGAHQEGRQGDSRGLRRRAYQRRRALRGVSKPRLSCFAGYVRGRGPKRSQLALRSYAIEGMATRKQAPPSGRLNASTVPSCASTTDFTMASPSPVPPVPRLRDGSPR